MKYSHFRFFFSIKLTFTPLSHSTLTRADCTQSLCEHSSCPQAPVQEEDGYEMEGCISADGCFYLLKQIKTEHPTVTFPTNLGFAYLAHAAFCVACGEAVPELYEPNNPYIFVRSHLCESRSRMSVFRREMS